MTREPLNHRISQTAAPSFARFEASIRRLRRLMVILLGAIVMLPTSIFFGLKVSHQREDIRVYAGQMALVVSHRLERQGTDLASLSPFLRDKMARYQILFLRLLGPEGKEILRLGEPQQQIFSLTTEVPLPAPSHLVSAVEIQRDVSALLPETARVLGIHVCVALGLALIVYVIPMRALRRAASDVRAAQTQAMHADKLRAIGEAYANLTHEINNPLSILLTRVKLIIDTCQKQSLPTPLVRDLRVIERHATRIADILRGLLPFVRKTPMEYVETDLNRVVNEAISLVEKPFAASAVRIEADLAAAPLICIGSPIHLQQVCLNLLNNARDAMPQGGRIFVRTYQTSSRMVVEVQDTGTGIASEIREQIFEPFFTTKEAGKGTGLGLAVSYGIIAEHGGEIEVDSLPGKGATFRLIFSRG